MRLFIERFVLAILAAFFVLAATNPMGFSWPQRSVGIIVIVALAGIAAYIAGWEEWRWQRLRGVWWLWLTLGISGGIAVAPWLMPLLLSVQTKLIPSSSEPIRFTPSSTAQVANQASPRQPPVGYFGDQYTGNAKSAISSGRIISIKAWSYPKKFIRGLRIDRDNSFFTVLGDVSGDGSTTMFSVVSDNDYITSLDIYQATGLLTPSFIIGIHITTKNGIDGNLGNAQGQAVFHCEYNAKMLTGFYIRYESVITGIACSFELPPD